MSPTRTGMSTSSAVRPAGGPSETVFARSRKRTVAPELLCERVYRPVAHLLVLALLPLRVAPPAVLLAATATGLAAAYAIAGGHLVVAAMVLQLKTVLDNADGQLARASNRVTVLGRYLDSESDLLVNAALFAALGYRTGQHVLAALSFVAVTLVLSANFNLALLARRERGEDVVAMPAAEGLARVFAGIYRVVYAPHDRLLSRLVERRLERLEADARGRRVYHDRATLVVLANFGLTTQLAALGVLLAVGRPTAYLWLVLASAAVLVLLLLRREQLVRTLRTHPRPRLPEEEPCSPSTP
jgi:archaetidylinositol phosphate synthase